MTTRSLVRKLSPLPFLVGLLIAAGCGSNGPGPSADSGGSAVGVGGSVGPVGGAGTTGGGTGGALSAGGNGTLGGSPSTGSAPSSGGSGGPSGGSDPGAGGGTNPAGGSPNWTYTKPDAPPANETGASLWLRYPLVPIEELRAEYVASLKQVVNVAAADPNKSVAAAVEELTKGLSGLTGATVSTGTGIEAGAVVVGTAADEPIKSSALATKLAAVGPEGYVVEAGTVDGKAVVMIAGNTPLGALYGSFAFLRHLQGHRALGGLSLVSSPRIKNRLLNHWDNLDRTVERGYAGRSIWDWSGLPGNVSPKYKEYARANASIGINGASLTNVNANAQVLTASYIAKVKAIADVLRPYGVRVFLTARFSAPIEIGGLNTADPSNAGVQTFWNNKVTEIYAAIPDFGGFLVKANSEGQPGPQEYNKTHADGANMLADALAPHNGIVLWRAFVYSSGNTDRITQAYSEFQPLDGRFKPNALVQVKNGPLDFQPREPISALFGKMPMTPLALEVQLTKEYLGEDTHLAYLGALFEEVLKTDTYAKGAGSTVSKVVDGSVHNYPITAISGVSNVGDDTNWTGSHMNQANWYAFGRLAWDPDGSSEAFAEEWVRQTFTNDPVVVGPVVQMMMSSREAIVNYMTPLGLAHIMDDDHHYGPAPWANNFADHPEWNPVYYHRADANGIGFDRTSSGSNAVGQYFPEVGGKFADINSIPDEYLLFFHHVDWDDKVKSSDRTVWEELVYRYSRGVDDVDLMRKAWEGVDGYIDAQRFGEVSDFLEIQHYEARWWRDACLTYFASVGQKTIPSGYAMPANNLNYYQGLNCPSNVTKPRCTQVYTGNPSPAITP